MPPAVVVKSRWKMAAPRSPRQAPDPVARRPCRAVSSPQNKIITQPNPLRQQVYAPGGRPVVLAPVNAGSGIARRWQKYPRFTGPCAAARLAGVRGNTRRGSFCHSTGGRAGVDRRPLQNGRGSYARVIGKAGRRTSSLDGDSLKIAGPMTDTVQPLRGPAELVA